MFTSSIDQRLLTALADSEVPSYYRIGLEKESLRVNPNATIATTAHPAQLGAALTHPHITTDFSEALLELVTPAFDQIPEVLDFLEILHRFVYAQLADEQLWATSMPCVLNQGQSIPLARYGQSNAGQMKTVYRRGLGYRYGRLMQLISGIHVNFSLNEQLWPLLHRVASAEQAALSPQAFRDHRYMVMVRNLQRLGWVVPYLFGASPAICASFLQGESSSFAHFDAHTLYRPFATSLRMGDIGYQNRQEEGTGMKACYDSLDAYIRSLTWAIETPCPQYESIGVKVNGQYRQLNDHVLQIENEYYSTVRPKQLTEWMERPTLALRRRGILYVELRSVDVNAFLPLGIDAEQLYFLATLMLYCLLLPGPRIDARERRAIDANELLAAHRGRDPELVLERRGQPIKLKQWLKELDEDLIAVAEVLDGDTIGPHRASVVAQQCKIDDPEATPSAQMLATMRSQGLGFAALARQLTTQHRDYFLAQPLPAAKQQWLEQLAAESHQRQQQIEAQDQLSFDDFLARYFAQSESVPVDLAVI